jgi:hypothetical protein
VVKLIHLGLNIRFDMLYLYLIIFSVESDVLVDNDVLLMMNFVNFKIKSAQSLNVLIRIGCVLCTRIYIYTIFLKKKSIHM